jgi:hypothetical protein
LRTGHRSGGTKRKEEGEIETMEMFNARDVDCLVENEQGQTLFLVAVPDPVACRMRVQRVEYLMSKRIDPSGKISTRRPFWAWWLNVGKRTYWRWWRGKGE